MTIFYKQGDLFDVKNGVIVHGCNARGVMGSGVAKVVREKYPMAYRDYHDTYVNQGGLLLGQLIIVQPMTDLWVCNMITQEFYGREDVRYVNYAAIASGFLDLFDWMVKLPSELHVVNMPKIGAGLGGGDWNIIEQIINDCDRTDKIQKICWELPQTVV